MCSQLHPGTPASVKESKLFLHQSFVALFSTTEKSNVIMPGLGFDVRSVVSAET